MINRTLFLMILSLISTTFSFCVSNVADIRLKKEQYVIRDQDNSELGRFGVEIVGTPVKTCDGLIFDIRLKDLNFSSEIHCDNKKVELDNRGVFPVLIPREKLRNKPFSYIIQFTSTDVRAIFDPIKFKIYPAVFLDADKKKVDLGKINYSNGSIATDKQRVVFRYSILKNATCCIYSKNNFCLKHERLEQYIPYHLEVSGSKIEDTDEGTRRMEINSDGNEFTMAIYVKEIRKGLPIAGKYKEELTVELVAD